MGKVRNVDSTPVHFSVCTCSCVYVCLNLLFAAAAAAAAAGLLGVLDFVVSILYLFTIWRFHD